MMFTLPSPGDLYLIYFFFCGCSVSHQLCRCANALIGSSMETGIKSTLVMTDLPIAICWILFSPSLTTLVKWSCFLKHSVQHCEWIHIINPFPKRILSLEMISVFGASSAFNWIHLWANFNKLENADTLLLHLLSQAEDLLYWHYWWAAQPSIHQPLNMIFLIISREFLSEGFRHCAHFNMRAFFPVNTHAYAWDPAASCSIKWSDFPTRLHAVMWQKSVLQPRFNTEM